VTSITDHRTPLTQKFEGEEPQGKLFFDSVGEDKWTRRAVQIDNLKQLMKMMMLRGKLQLDGAHCKATYGVEHILAPLRPARDLFVLN
jgi:hypothetical protein